MYGFAPKWAAGLRYEYVTGTGGSVGDFGSRNEDPFRDTRHHVSPLLLWQFAPTASARLQYNYDHARHLDDDDSHAVWAGLAWHFGFGSPSHGQEAGEVHSH